MNQKIKYSKEQIDDAIVSSNSIKEVIQHLGMHVNTGSYRIIHFYAKYYGIELPIFPKYMCAYNAHKKNRTPDVEFFANNTHWTGYRIKRRMIDVYGIKDECILCGNEGYWNGKDLTLQVDHINGDRFDNRIENLRIVCPNCHSQTRTFSNKNKKRYNYCVCGERIGNKYMYCQKCTWENKKRSMDIVFKIDWPSDDELISMLLESNFSSLGKKLGVSDNAIRKRMRSRGIMDYFIELKKNGKL